MKMYKKIERNSLSANKIFMLLLFDTLYMFPYVIYIGLFTLILTLILPVYYTINKRIVNNTVFLFVFLFTSYNLLLLSKGNIVTGLYNCALQILVVLFITCFENLEVNERFLRRLSRACEKTVYVLVAYNFILLIFQKQLGIIYRGYYYAMRPVLFGMMLLSFFSQPRTNKQLYIRVLVYSLLMFLFTERTQSLGLILLILYHSLFSKIEKRSNRILLFICHCIFIVAIPFLFIILYNSKYSLTLNQLVAQYTNKNLFSGRQVLWANAITLIKDSLLTGHGYSDYTFTYGLRSMSVHNTFLYMTLQGGVVSTILVFLLFYILFSKLNNKPRNYEVTLSLSMIPLVMFLASFGLILFANNILYSVFLWAAIGIGLIKIYYEE